MVTQFDRHVKNERALAPNEATRKLEKLVKCDEIWRAINILSDHYTAVLARARAQEQ